MKQKNKAWLLTGSNVGDRLQNLGKARELITEQCGIITSASSLYETEPWGNTHQPQFLNQALEIETSLSAPELMQEILKVEESIGRKRRKKYDPRLIDIDILLFNDERADTDLIRIPHPEMTRRRFVLVPLAEIAPQIIHPVLGKKIKQLLEECPDKLAVKKFYPRR
jgi:2-amino-4-hydroxy-6-hydroxymethyldihydropteridine diphosphokinase